MSLSIRDHLSAQGLDKWVAELGCTDAPVPRQGIKAALAFFNQQMPHLALKDAVGFLAAMDLSKPVRPVTLGAGERIIGFRTGTESPFKLFFARRGSAMHSSGINTNGRGAVHFTVRSPVVALETSTGGTKDSWSATAPGQRVGMTPRARKWFGQDFGVMVAGGGGQLIVPGSYSALLVESR